MKTTIIQWPCLALGATLLFYGCSIFGEDERVEVALAASAATVSSTNPVTINVTANNQGEGRVVWGRGSSSCQLGAVIQVGNENCRIDIRACTSDLAEQGLEPGEHRNESWLWDGQIFQNNQAGPLPAGRYKIYGTAGGWLSKAPIEIEIKP
ncbi:MAG: hypothetical protein ACREOI_23075 [bacterium]